MTLGCIADTDLPVEQALGRGATLLESVGVEHTALLYSASLSGKALVLGGWQCAHQAVHYARAQATGLPLWRRLTGGPTVYAGEGITYVALCLADASALMECPPQRVLNRNVRGMLTGLTLAGAPTHYFGRDWLSSGRRPLASCAWYRDGQGRVLLEFFVGVQTSFATPAEWIAYPQSGSPRLLGKQPTTIAEVTASGAGAVAPTAGDLADALVTGHAQRFGVAAKPTGLVPAETQRSPTVDLEAEKALSWSAPRAVAIGFASAGVRQNEHGEIEEVRLGGDFFQDRGAARALSQHLVGQRPDPERYALALNATYGHGAPYVIEGVRDLGVLRDALLEAMPLR